MEGWTQIYSTTSSALANMKKHLLEEKGISVVVLNQQDSLYNNFGDIKIYVKPENAIKAIRIIEEDDDE
ncbi:MAG: DUF2007 domain-containing protein [Crocinitomicaceae bacterium]|nr:DUF2007 domain-containing protein [Crocinitomicaceae bacterium]